MTIRGRGSGSSRWRSIQLCFSAAGSPTPGLVHRREHARALLRVAGIGGRRRAASRSRDIASTGPRSTARSAGTGCWACVGSSSCNGRASGAAASTAGSVPSTGRRPRLRAAASLPCGSHATPTLRRGRQRAPADLRLARIAALDPSSCSRRSAARAVVLLLGALFADALPPARGTTRADRAPRAVARPRASAPSGHGRSPAPSPSPSSSLGLRQHLRRTSPRPRPSSIPSSPTSCDSRSRCVPLLLADVVVDPLVAGGGLPRVGPGAPLARVRPRGRDRERRRPLRRSCSPSTSRLEHPAALPPRPGERLYRVPHALGLVRRSS